MTPAAPVPKPAPAKSNKDTATELFTRFSANDIAGAVALMTEDVTWRVPGSPELSAVAGIYDKGRLKRLWRRMLSQLDEQGMKMTVTGMMAEGERVAVEVRSSGDLRNGRKYRQRYHFLMAFRDGKIEAVREYHDTHHAYEVWLKP
jgi:ketosteroid isomerase-like protein